MRWSCFVITFIDFIRIRDFVIWEENPVSNADAFKCRSFSLSAAYVGNLRIRVNSKRIFLNAFYVDIARYYNEINTG